MPKRLLLIVAGGVLLILLGAAAFVYGGFYNVAASVPHNPVTAALLDFGMRRSVAAHAPENPAPPLSDPAMIQRGLRHFEANCAPCHGAPGVPPAPLAAAMLPQPPDLGEKIGRFTDNEIFWIVRHGLKYTGMPGWPADSRADEVWDVVAFIRLLPEITPEDYQSRIAARPSAAEGVDAAPLALIRRGPEGTDAAACARCHGLDGTGHPTGAFPRLDGLSAAYIAGELDAFADGRRPSGFMQAAVAPLSATKRAAVAAYYGAIPAQGSDAAGAGQGPETAAGARLVAEGIPDRGVPPCASCHLNPDVAAPLLSGQSRHYLATQLMLFRDGDRPSDVMTAIAAELSDADIAALAAYFAGLPRR